MYGKNVAIKTSSEHENVCLYSHDRAKVKTYVREAGAICVSGETSRGR